MNTLEDRVRQALQEAAEDISRTDVPLLRLPDRAGRGRLARGWRGWPPWLTPLAAAAAVAAVLAATLTLTGGPGRSSPHRTGADALLASAPRYYIVLPDPGRNLWRDQLKQTGWQKAQIRATATGRVVATITPPPDSMFTMVATASGVGRYVLATQRTVVQLKGNVGYPRQVGPIRLYQLQMSSSGQVSALSPLPFPALPADAYLSGLALTPDGRKLAVAIQTGGPRPGPEIQVDTLATGAQRVWTWPGAQPIAEGPGGGTALSWAADDSTLAFVRQIDGQCRVRLLDTTAPGSSLAASRLALSLNETGNATSRRFSHGRAVNYAVTSAALLTPDGSKIVVATVTESLHPLTSELGFTEFSARTGKVVAVLGRWRLVRRWPEQEQAVLWTNADGSTLLVLAHRPGVTVRPTSPSSGSSFGVEFGVLHGERYAPLPDEPRPGQLGIFPAW